MGFADLHGRARVDPSAPEAFGVCDQCGVWYQRRDLGKQYEFNGRGTYWTGYLVCPTCLDKPQPQLLTPILPPDPRPVIQPRPERPTSSFIAPRFSLFELALNPGDPATVLAQVAALSGVATPTFATQPDQASVPITTPQQQQNIIALNGSRAWLVVYNPNDTPIVVSTGQAAFGGDPNAILLGAGQAMFATAPVYQGALTAIGYFAGVDLFVFESPVTPSTSFPPIPVFAP